MSTPRPVHDIRERVTVLIMEIASAIQARGMYGGAHKLSRDAVTKLSRVLADIFEDRDEITIGIIGDEVIFEKEPLYELARTTGGFTRGMRDAGIDKITFLGSPSSEEIAGFLTVISAPPREGGPEEIHALLESAGVSHIILGQNSAAKEGFAGMMAGNLAELAKDTFQDGEKYLEKTFDDIKQNKPIDVSAARFFVVKLIGNLARNKNSLLMLTSIKEHDEYTFVHSINVAIFSVIQAEALGLGERALNEIGVAGLLHDTGKLVLPGDLLRKSEELSEDELRQIHDHPAGGAKILLRSLGESPLAAIGAFEHHIRFDQKGYPPRIFSGPINPASMMIAIADVYDALRSKRAYHEDMAPEKTYDEMMKLSAKNFDPKLLANFFQIVGVYPPGTIVELSDRSIGIVLRESSLDIRRPQVELLYDAHGQKAAASRILNLLEKIRDTGDYRWTVTRSIAPGKCEVPAKFTA